MTARPLDISIMVLNAWAEARGEGRDGIRAQVHSVINRHKAGKWYSRKTLAACCLAPYAYSCWTAADQNDTLAAEAPADDPEMIICGEEVEDALNGNTIDPTDGATHYYASGTPAPSWVSGIVNGEQKAPPAIFCKKIGRHIFYRGVA